MDDFLLHRDMKIKRRPPPQDKKNEEKIVCLHLASESKKYNVKTTIILTVSPTIRTYLKKKAESTQTVHTQDTNGRRPLHTRTFT